MLSRSPSLIDDPQKAIAYLSSELAKRRFVCRNWRAFSTTESELYEKWICIEFKFMCPCGGDVIERFPITFSRIEQQNVIDFGKMFDAKVRRGLHDIVRELESHLEGENAG